MLIKLTNDIFYPSNKIAAKITIVMLAHAGEKVKTVTRLHLKKACGYDLKEHLSIIFVRLPVKSSFV